MGQHSLNSGKHRTGDISPWACPAAFSLQPLGCHPAAGVSVSSELKGVDSAYLHFMQISPKPGPWQLSSSHQESLPLSRLTAAPWWAQRSVIAHVA